MHEQNTAKLAKVGLGELEEARGIMERCLAIKRKLFAEEHPEVRMTRKNLEAVGKT